MAADYGQIKEEEAAATCSLLENHDWEIAIKKAVAERLGEPRFSLWFGEGVHFQLSKEDFVLTVYVPSLFFSDWIRDHFTDSLIEAVQDVTGYRVHLSFRLKSDVEPPIEKHTATARGEQRTAIGEPAIAAIPHHPNRLQVPSGSPPDLSERPSHRRFIPPVTNQVISSLTGQQPRQVINARAPGGAPPFPYGYHAS